MADILAQEIDANFDSFMRQVHKLLPEQAGRFALMKGREIKAFFDRPADAELEGFLRFPDGIFSVQEVAELPVDLGFYNYAVDQGSDHGSQGCS
ncbi:MAG: hypothetical protein R3E09_01350 [Novosphingobium sp.]|nr:hypothetical protein [Novosphingobium sp.]